MRIINAIILIALAITLLWVLFDKDALTDKYDEARKPLKSDYVR